MNLKLDKDSIISKFLVPVSRVTDDCSINISKDKIYTLVNDTQGNIILYCNIDILTGLDVNETLTLNIKDVKKLIRVFECIKSTVVDLVIDKNSSIIKHKSPELSFKLHLVTDNVIRKCQISLEKVSSLTYDTEFLVSGDTLSDIIKGSIFTTETNKIYFYLDNNTIYAELTDRATQDVDSITFPIATSYTGVALTTPLPFNIEVLQLIASLKTNNIKVRINNKYQIISFNITSADTRLNYIIPAIVK